MSTTPMLERVLYLEPLRRRMSVELGGRIVARSDDVVLLFEPARYPVAYFTETWPRYRLTRPTAGPRIPT